MKKSGLFTILVYIPALSYQRQCIFTQIYLCNTQIYLCYTLLVFGALIGTVRGAYGAKSVHFIIYMTLSVQFIEPTVP